MGVVTGRKIDEDGIAESLTACTYNGDVMNNSGIEFIKFENEHASLDYNITITPAVTALQTSLHGKSTKSVTTLRVNNGNCGYAGPCKPNVWSDENGQISMTYLTVAGAALNSSAGTHLLKCEVLYIDYK